MESDNKNRDAIHDQSTQTELEKCQIERDEWKDRCLRTAADFENFKKRSEKDRLFLIQQTQSTILKSIIDIVDDFDRAFMAIDMQKLDENAKQLLTGFTLIHQAFTKFLIHYGVQEMTDYRHFDPTKHEALMQVESSEHQSGDIVQVLQKGYLFKGQVLRPAKVSVAK